MANKNTKRKRAAGEAGYGQKRGRALHTGFGQADGSRTRRGPVQYRVPGARARRWTTPHEPTRGCNSCTPDWNAPDTRHVTGPAHEPRIWSVRSSVRSDSWTNQLQFHADHSIINTCNNNTTNHSTWTCIRYSNMTDHWTSSSTTSTRPWCTWEVWRATSTDSWATRHTPYAKSHDAVDSCTCASDRVQYIFNNNNTHNQSYVKIKI